MPPTTACVVTTTSAPTEREVVSAARIWAAATARRDDLDVPEPWERKLVGVRARLTSPGAVLFLADGPQGPSGFAVATPDASHAELSYLAVDPQAWGHGTAAALLAAVERWATALGAAEVVLWVLDDNARAQDVYARAGWVPTRERQRTAPSGRLERRLRLTLHGRRDQPRS